MSTPSSLTKLSLKHRIVTSGLATPVSALRGQLCRLTGLRNAKRGLFSCKDDMMEGVMTCLVRRDWNCLDSGARLRSVFYRLTQLAPDGTHAMIKASPGKVKMLCARFGKGRGHEVKVTDTPGQISFCDNIDQPASVSRARRTSRRRQEERKIEIARCDDQFVDVSSGFIKIDVEAQEYPASNGGNTALRSCLPLAPSEVGAEDDVNMGDDAAQLYEWLTKDPGYSIYAALDLYYNCLANSAARFQSYRNYPFLTFNYFAVFPDQPYR